MTSHSYPPRSTSSCALACAHALCSRTHSPINVHLHKAPRIVTGALHVHTYTHSCEDCGTASMTVLHTRNSLSTLRRCMMNPIRFPCLSVLYSIVISCTAHRPPALSSLSPQLPLSLCVLAACVFVAISRISRCALQPARPYPPLSLRR